MFASKIDRIFPYPYTRDYDEALYQHVHITQGNTQHFMKPFFIYLMPAYLVFDFVQSFVPSRSCNEVTNIYGHCEDHVGV